MNSNNINLNFRYFSFYVYSFYVERVLMFLTPIRIFTDKIRGLFNDLLEHYTCKPLNIMKHHFLFRRFDYSYLNLLCKNYVILNIIELLFRVVFRHVV